MHRLFGAAAMAGAILALNACGSVEQRHRDDLRFGSTKRGTEVYLVDRTALRLDANGTASIPVSQDSFSLGQEASQTEIEFYRRYKAIVGADKIAGPDKQGRAELQRLSEELQRQSFQNHSLLQLQHNRLEELRRQLSRNPPPAATPPSSGLQPLPTMPPRVSPMTDIQPEPAEQPLLKSISFVPRQDETAPRPAVPAQVFSGEAKPHARGAEPAPPPVPRNFRDAPNRGARAQTMTDRSAGAEMEMLPPQPPKNDGDSVISQIEYLWPIEIIRSPGTKTVVVEEGGKKTTTTTGISDELIRAMSSTASVAQMRDLLTEPTFPSMLPVERRVDLGCVLPPDSVAWEAVTKLELAAKTREIEASLSSEYKSAVVKLFEESEKTLFLQYALFRLCEMSINAPAGFRNIYPVIIHDIVRRTAEMQQQDIAAIEGRRAEEQKTKQKAVEVEIAKRNAEIQAEKTKTDLARKAAIDAEAALVDKRTAALDAEVKGKKELTYQSCLASGMATAAGDAAKLKALSDSCAAFK